MTTAVAGVVTALVLLTAVSANADSDGYYCVGRGYIAYELRSAITPGITDAHVLRTVRFGPEVTVFRAVDAVLDDFQTHEMTCEPDRVRIAGWDRMPLEYVVALGETPRVVHHARFPGQPFVPPKVRLPNLGLWLRPGHVPLPSADPAHTYRLALDDQETRGSRGGIRHRVRSELQRVDRAGAVVARLVLYEGERLEVVH